MRQKINYEAVFRKLGGRSIRGQNADFELIECELCGHQYLADHEILTVYLSPDLKESSLFDIQGEPNPPCRGCGAIDWGYVTAEQANSEWKWVIE